MFDTTEDDQDTQPPVQRKVLKRQPASDDEILIQEGSAEGDKIGASDFACGCGKPSWMLTKSDKIYFTSWSGKIVCKLHVKYCETCGDTLCTAGNADGYRLDYKGKPEWYCPDCYEIRRKEILRLNFWEGLKEGFFGKG